ncbi:hypothetical protein psal_cds_28 [Pandoravirus salinus]|uniref:Uncharacterized protein n=1 Tax=Pandoravirus salinus TaxID=1349410 RepID=S4VSW7_9VIRU|nr:hypothetical protein psal_cds_28 [Pandoravirus salinus]AGO83398.1 hypothetical protein psal_cds_28 [Pandoravirus salinus]
MAATPGRAEAVGPAKKRLGLCGMCEDYRVTPQDDADGHMLFTTDGDAWPLCGVCVDEADRSSDGCAFCLGSVPDTDRVRPTAAISLYQGDSVAGICDGCFPYDLGESDDDGDDDDDDADDAGDDEDDES